MIYPGQGCSDLASIALPLMEDKALISMTATVPDSGTSSRAIAVTSATRQIASVTSQDTNGSSVQADTFGPAVVVEISDEAKEAENAKPYDMEERIKYLKVRYAERAKERGASEEEQKTGAEEIEKNFRESFAHALESRAQYEKSEKILATQQGNMEGALDQAGGAPQALINAVRDVNSFRYAAGGAGSSVVYDDPKIRQQIRQDHGEDVLQKITELGKAYDAASTLRAQGSAAALGRYGLEGSAFTMDDGHFKMNAFTLGKIAGGYSMSFDPKTSAFTVMRQGEDITAAIFKGTAFRQG